MLYTWDLEIISINVLLCCRSIKLVVRHLPCGFIIQQKSYQLSTPSILAAPRILVALGSYTDCIIPIHAQSFSQPACRVFSQRLIYCISIASYTQPTININIIRISYISYVSGVQLYSLYKSSKVMAVYIVASFYCLCFTDNNQYGEQQWAYQLGIYISIFGLYPQAYQLCCLPSI